MEARRQDEIGIVAWMFRAWRRWLWWRGAIVFLIGVGAVAFSYLERNFYAAEAKLIYVHTESPTLGSLSGTSPGAMALRSLGLGELGGGVLLPDLLRSRDLLATVLRDTVEFEGQRLPIHEIYSPIEDDDADRARAFDMALDEFRLSYMSANYDNRNDLVSLRVLAPSPDLAAYMANRMTELLNARLVQGATQQAGERGEFIQGRLESVNDELREAELALKNYREENRDIGTSPALRMEESRLMRRVNLNEQIFGTLTVQYELTRIEALKNLPVIDVIEAGTPPYRKAMPNRRLRGLTGIFFALMGVALWDAVRFWRATQPALP